MWWGLLQICWICLMLDGKCRGASVDPTETPTLSVEAEMNGKIQPSTLEIFSSIIDENPAEFSGDSELTTDFDNREYFNEKFKNILTNDDNLFMNNFEDIADNIRNIEDTSGRRTINKLSEATKEGFTARKGTTRNLNGSKSHHTTKRSIDLTATSPEIPKEKSLNPKYPSLFLDSDRTVGNLAAKLKPLTDGSDKDVVQRGLEKDGNRMDWLGGETAKELLDIEDIPSESKVVLPGNIVTKLSVQETVDGQTIQRKPTEEELHLAQSELEADNDIMGRDHKFLEQNKQTNNSSYSDVIADVDTILRPDPGFADDDTDFISSDWSDDEDDDDDDDVADMESILKDDMDVFKRFHDDNGHSDIMEMEQPSGDYRTIFHTESKNFSNVKEERIEISETEGDLFDDDNDHFPSLHSSNENGIKSVSEIAFSSNNNTNNITEDSTPTVTKLNETFASTFTPSSADSTTTKLISADNVHLTNDTTELSKFSETETTISNTPTVNSITTDASTVSTVATEPAGEILAENGISIKDFNDIISLTENSFHEIDVPNNETTVVTRISIQETVDGQTIERKPTEEELHLGFQSVETTTIAEIFKIATKRDEILKEHSDNFTTPLIHAQTDKISEPTTQLSNEGIPTTESMFETTFYAKDKATTVNVESVDEFNTSVGPATIPIDTTTVDLLIKSSGETSNNLQETTEHEYSSTEETTLKALPTENTSTDAEDINDILNRFVNKTDEIEKYEITPSEVEHDYNSTEKTTLKTLPTENTDSVQSSTDAEDINAVLNRFINKIDEIEEHEITPSEVESMFNSKIEEYEDDDYDSKEHSVVSNGTKEGGYIFGEPTDVQVDNNLGLDEDDKNEMIGQRVQLVPLLKATILNRSAEFNVKISKKEDSFYVPSSASIKEYDNIINITWRITEAMNNSVAMRIFEKEEFYMIKEIITHLFTGNKFKTQQKPVAFHPDPVMDDTMPGRTRIVMMKDGTYITFSNVEFLKKVPSTDDSREISEATRRDPKLWHFEVASICIVTVIIVAFVLYVIAIKTRAKVTLREKDELPQVTHC